MHTALHAEGGLRSDLAHAELKQRLLLGEFRLNVRLGEERLASLVGVSRTPIREALQRLHAEGLVRRSADGGFVPVAPDVDVVRDLYEVRIGLEQLALRRPLVTGAPHRPEVLDGLHAEWTALAESDHADPDPSFVLLDEAFHVGLAEAAGNPGLADLLRQVNERIRVVRMHDFMSVERISSTIDEHLGILGAVMAGDLPGAEARFSEHVERSMSVVEQRVARAVARMITGGDEV